MSLLDRLFGKGRHGSSDEKSIAEHLDYLSSLKEPAIRMRRSEEEQFSRIGGLPNMPSGLAWPEWNGKPLAFLCQLDLSRIPQEYSRQEPPRSGHLYFFYDQEQSTWGFDPKDKGSWHVLYTPDDVRDCRQREAPDGLNKDYVYGEKFVILSLIHTYPDWQDERVGSLGLTDKQADEYIDLCSSVFENQPSHHLFGYPSPVQGNDMDLECQLVSNGLYCGDPSAYNDERARELEKGRSDWVLLLQLDTDDETGMMWGDCGMLYFWIKKHDLKAGRFDNCWMILQCS